MAVGLLAGVVEAAGVDIARRVWQGKERKKWIEEARLGQRAFIGSWTLGDHVVGSREIWTRNKKFDFVSDPTWARATTRRRSRALIETRGNSITLSGEP